MIVVHFISFDGIGGAEMFTMNLIKEQLQRSEITKVILVTYQLTNPNVDLNLGIKDKKFKHINIKYCVRYLIHFKLLIYFYLIIKKEKIQLIHSHLNAAIYLSILCKIFKHKKFIHTVHSQALKELVASKNSIYYLLRKKYYNKCTLISISDSVKNSITDLYGLNSKLIVNGAKFIKKYNSNDVANIYSDPNYIYFLAVGNTRKEKNFEMLISAFKNISTEKKLMLIILGELLDDFININPDQYRKHNIYFMGYVNNIQDYMKKSDFLCMTSKYEGMPITLLESAANGLVPIVTPVPGILDVIVDDHNGIISKNESVDEYINALHRAINMDPLIKKEMISNGKSLYLDKYSMDRCEKEYYSCYSNI